MVFLLDSNAIGDLMRRNPNLEQRFRSVVTPDRVAVSTIVRGEVLYGIERLPTGKRKSDLRADADDVLRQYHPNPYRTGRQTSTPH